jgi:hypothetical protein
LSIARDAEFSLADDRGIKSKIVIEQSQPGRVKRCGKMLGQHDVIQEWIAKSRMEIDASCLVVLGVLGSFSGLSSMAGSYR